jgi:hypothetical protein
MTTHEHPVELAGVNLAGRNHVCAFFNTIDEEHRVLGPRGLRSPVPRDDR